MRNISAYVVLTFVLLIGPWQLVRSAGADQKQQQTGVPTFQIDPSWPRMEGNWIFGSIGGITIDPTNDHVWVAQRPGTLDKDENYAAQTPPKGNCCVPAPPIMEFTPEGTLVQGWGGPGEGYDWPEREHGIHIDYKGFVWIGGNNCPARGLPGLQPVGDDQLLKFTQAGKFVMQIGHSSESTGNADTKNMHQPADAVVYRKTNELFVADGYGNHRVIVFDADTGQFKRMWGAFGNKPVDLDKCPPPSLNAVPDGPGPQQFSIVHAIRVSDDGLVYVADRENRRVQVFTTEGKFI